MTTDFACSCGATRHKALGKCASCYRRFCYQQNGDSERKRQREYARLNSAKRAESNKKWRESNPETARTSKNRSRRRRYANDATYRFLTVARCRVNEVFRSLPIVRPRSIDLLGCAPERFRAHLAEQFRPGMTVENHGRVWHIDHIIPCARFDLSKPEHVRVCFHYTNLQPLFVAENLIKNDGDDSFPWGALIKQSVQSLGQVTNV